MNLLLNFDFDSPGHPGHIFLQKNNHIFVNYANLQVLENML